MNQKLRINVRLRGEIVQQFWQVKNHLGLQNDTEVVRSLVKWYHREHRQQLPNPFVHLNTYSDTVLIRDKMLDNLVTLRIKSLDESSFQFYCENCGSTSCRHIRFATTVPDVLSELEEKGYVYTGEHGES
ncbi:hypothetical protein GWM83_03700 [Candidatus Bathyarchaeota archaeon]|nr:hypothetical protein [Desulfobacterales bacterium]NIW34646.1 hypothetical protein [Candidatus Bathyarchaeota archaeon]